MQKILFGFFAHPDDESFGVAGTLLMERAAGTEIRLVTLTDGGEGTNRDNHANLGAQRRAELAEASRLMDIPLPEIWDYQDGLLSNVAMIEIAERFETYVTELLRKAPAECEVEFMSYDTNGISGHIDHIVASRAACLAFYRLRKNEPRLKRLRLRCLSEEVQPQENIDWLYMERGLNANEIDEVVDAREHLATIHAVMQAHTSQKEDYLQHVERLGDKIALNHFRVKS